MKETLFQMMESKPLDYGRLQHLQEGLTMDPEFVEKQSFQVVGIEMHSSEGYVNLEAYGNGLEDKLPRVLQPREFFMIRFGLRCCRHAFIHHSSIALRRS